MEITNFSRFRINGRENFVDVSGNGKYHVSDVVELTAYDFESFVEIRRKEGKTAMIVSRYGLDVSDFWKDAEVVYSNLGEKEL